MEIVPTNILDRHIKTSYPAYEDVIGIHKEPTNTYGLSCRYVLRDSHHNNTDFPWYDFRPDKVVWTNREFSIDNQEILRTHLKETETETGNPRVIVEIGVHRNAYHDSSTGIILQDKKDEDIYLGIDIEDKSFLDNPAKNVYTIRCSSTDKQRVLNRFESLGIKSIQVLVVDGWHSLKQVYDEWELYAPLVSKNGKIIFHDTNAHPGPYFVSKSIDTSMFSVQKYLNDIQDWGITVATRL